MPLLEWIGKAQVVNHVNDIPFHVMEPKYHYGDDSNNMVIHGDNLVALKSLLPEYEGLVCNYRQKSSSRGGMV